MKMRVKNLVTKLKCQLSQFQFPISPFPSVQFLPNSSSSFWLFERNGILPFSSTLYHSSFRRGRPRQRRSYSSDTNDRNASDASALLVLEKAGESAKATWRELRRLIAASAAKELVAKCTNEKTIHDTKSSAVERRKNCHFLPQLRGATKNLLNATEAVDSLSHSIEGIRVGSRGGNKDNINTNKDVGRRDPNKSAEICLRELHRAFLNLTQALLNHYEAMMEENCHEYRIDRFYLLESVLALSYRAHQLSLPYHWPLYQRLAIVVAKHQTPLDENITAESTTMNSLTTCSRAEWIQKIHGWSIFPRGSGSDDGDYIHDGQTKNSDLEWFHPPLKVLAADGRWSDVCCILTDLLRPVSDLIPNEDEDYTRDLYIGSNKGRNYHHDTLITTFEDDYDSENDDDYTVKISSPTAIPFLAEEFVLDILLQLERQGLLANLWRRENGSRYPPSHSVNQTCDILLMMEASIWNVFGGNPGHSVNSCNKEDSYSDKSVQKNSGRYNLLYHGASLRDAIELLLTNNGAKNDEKYNRTDIDDNEEDDDDDDDGDCLVKTFRDLEDLLNDQQDVNDDDENEMQSQHASDAFALATELSNQMLPDIISNPSTEDFLSNNTDDDYLDFIYDDRAEDYRDNIPDVTSQLYLNNGNQELLYTSSLERHIYEDMQPPGGYNSDDE